jgi:hypothetical protein
MLLINIQPRLLYLKSVLISLVKTIFTTMIPQCKSQKI